MGQNKLIKYMSLFLAIVMVAAFLLPVILS